MDFVDGSTATDVAMVTTVESNKSPFKTADKSEGCDFEVRRSPRRQELGGSSPARSGNGSPKRLVDGEDDDSSRSPPHQPCITDLGSIVRRVRNVRIGFPAETRVYAYSVTETCV